MEEKQKIDVNKDDEVHFYEYLTDSERDDDEDTLDHQDEDKIFVITPEKMLPAFYFGQNAPLYEDVASMRRKIHPIHSLTDSDIERAVISHRNKDCLRGKSQICCSIIAIIIAILVVIAVVFIVTNIVSNMYIKY